MILCARTRLMNQVNVTQNKNIKTHEKYVVASHSQSAYWVIVNWFQHLCELI